MNWKKMVAEYFTFTRGNRIAILTILFVVIGVFFLPDSLTKNDSNKLKINDTTWIASLKSIEQRDADNSTTYTKYNDNNSSNYQFERNSNNYYSKSKGELFYFDPNTLSAEGWKKLGIRDKTYGTIQNYLSKGGKFRKPEDVSKVYGLFPNEYERIAPYIKIQAADNRDAYENFQDTKGKEDQIFKSNSKNYSEVNINTADANEFITLPGIGPTLSVRIVNFRDKLGGYYSINQIAETFGLPDSTFQKIKQYLKIETTSVRKININTVTIDELKAHPYLKWSVANAIIAYRNQHGPFSELEHIKKIMVVSEDLYSKLSPYLTIQ